jgi:hypothetical protein
MPLTEIGAIGLYTIYFTILEVDTVLVSCTRFLRDITPLTFDQLW